MQTIWKEMSGPTFGIVDMSESEEETQIETDDASDVDNMYWEFVKEEMRLLKEFFPKHSCETCYEMSKHIWDRMCEIEATKEEAI